MHDDPFVVYPYRLTATSPFGRIPDSALPGSEVPVDTSLPHFHATEGGDFLKLYLVHNGPASDVSKSGASSNAVLHFLPSLFISRLSSPSDSQCVVSLFLTSPRCLLLVILSVLSPFSLHLHTVFY